MKRMCMSPLMRGQTRISRRGAWFERSLLPNKNLFLFLFLSPEMERLTARVTCALGTKRWKSFGFLRIEVASRCLEGDLVQTLALAQRSSPFTTTTLLQYAQQPTQRTQRGATDQVTHGMAWHDPPW